MHKKYLLGIVGVTVLFLTLSGCSSNAGDANAAAPVPQINSQIAEEQNSLSGTSTNNESAPAAYDSSDNGENNITDNTSSPIKAEQNHPTDTSSNHDDIKHLLPEGIEIPEGLVLSLPPTQISVGLADGADVPLVVMGERFIFDGQGPVMLGGEVFVPVSGVFDNVNPVYPFITTWDGDTVTIRNPHVTVSISEIPGHDATFEHQLSRPFPGFTPVVPSQTAQRINGEFMLPLQPIAEAIGLEFEWVEERGEVHIFIILEGFGIAVSGNNGDTMMLRPPNPFVYKN